MEGDHDRSGAAHDGGRPCRRRDRARNRLRQAKNFTAGKAAYPGGGPPATASKTITVTSGHPQQSVDVFIADGDRLHHKGRHSYEEFALNSANIKPLNTFFPKGTDLDAKGDAALDGAAAGLKSQFEADAAIARFELASGSVNVGFERQLDGKYRMTQLYPSSGGEELSRGVLRAIRDLIQ